MRFEFKYDESTDYYRTLIYKDSDGNTISIRDTAAIQNDFITDIMTYIAPYWGKKPYPVNSLVRYGFGSKTKLYYNPHEISTAENWTAAHWTETTIAEYIKIVTT